MIKVIKSVIVLFIFSITVSNAQSIREALQYADREQFQNAKNILLGLVKTDTKSTDQYYYLGDIYFKNEQYDSARYWFMQGVKLNENGALNYVGLGKVAMEKNATEGRANFDKAITLVKKDGRVHAAIAEYFLSLPKPEIAKALEYGMKAVELDAKNYNAKIILGDIHYANNDGSKAIEQYKAALNTEPSSPIALWKMGKLYLSAKNYDLGLQYFKDGLVLDKNFAPIYRDMGELYYKARKFEKAIESYKTYLELRDKSDDADLRYASFLFLNEDYKTAIGILKALDEKKYDNFLVYRLLAYSQYETKDFVNALSSMNIYWNKVDSKKIITQDYEYHGKILAKNNQDSLAVVFLTKALERDTTKYELYGEMGNILFSSKNYAKAAEAYKKKIAGAGANVKSTVLANDYLSLGRAYMLDKNYTEADLAFGKVTEYRSDLPIGFLYRARANANLDPKQEKALAKPYYEKYIELAKVDAEKNKKDLIEAYIYAGSYYYFVVKDKVKSDEAWNNVRTLDPTNKAAAEAAKLK